VSPDDLPPSRRRRWRRATGALLALAVPLALVACAFAWGVAIPGDFLRAPLERALGAAFGVATRIEGPLSVRLGRFATVTADALALADPAGPTGATLARATRPAAIIDLSALARLVVALQEVAGEHLELELGHGADGRPNWAPMLAGPPGGGSPSVAFGGIARLRIGTVAGRYRGASGTPVPFTVAALDAALPLRDPTTARGTATIADHVLAFDLRTASLAELQGSIAALPLQGTLGWSGASLTLDGKVAFDGPRLDAVAGLTAEDAGPLLAALGVAAREPGRLDARGRIVVTGSDASATDLGVTLGKSSVSGKASVGWGTPRSRWSVDLAGERADLEPFLSARPPAADETPLEAFVALLEYAAAGFDADLKATVVELTGVPVTAREVELEVRSGDGTTRANGRGIVSGTRVEAALAYDAREAQRVLTARIDGGAGSSARLPEGERPRALAGTTAGIRGRLSGQGASPRAVVASLQGSLDARDLRLTLRGREGKPLHGHFDMVRIAVQGTRTSSAAFTGKIEGATCTLKASGGAFAPLLDGAQWPVQVAGSCPGERLSAKGRVALAKGHVTADLAFDATADRIGPVARALGLAPDAPHPIAVRGNLSLDENQARVRFDAIRLGRTSGSGEVVLPLGTVGVPRVRLALTRLNLDEIAASGGTGSASADPYERVVVHRNVALPDVDFEIDAETVVLAAETLRRARMGGGVRANRLPPARFGFEWRGVAVSGAFGADFARPSPQVQLEGAARDLDLGPLLVRLGYAGVGLRAGALSLSARTEGSQLGELLASATLEVTLDRARLDVARPPIPGMPNQAALSATLKAAPGQPATLAARGTVRGEPFDVHLETPGLAGLARAGEAIPATLRLTLGDARLQFAGKVGRDGSGEGRVQLAGERLDRLGTLVGADWPAAGPYAASVNLAVSAAAIRASDVDVSFGRSRLHGQAQLMVRRAGRTTHSGALRASALHLEDIGAARWLRGPAPPGAEAQRAAADVERALGFLRTSDVDVTLDLDGLHSGGERFAEGRVRATLAAGKLRVVLQDLRTSGGTVDAELRVDATGPQPKFTMRARADGLDFGPLARAVDPATRLGGRVDFVADLAAQGPPGKLLPGLAGSSEVAVFPHDLRPGALAFWGTGLLGTMLRSIDAGARSEVECAVASVAIGGGIARTTALFVDTTRVRIIGQVQAELATQVLSGTLRTVSKQPELFTVAPTMSLGGTIEDPRFTVAAENLLLAPLRFATPLGGFALDWLGAKGGLRDSAVGCREAFERARKLSPGNRGGQ
jgi:uncharacterized protein involved in outer membrane biogenesis